MRFVTTTAIGCCAAAIAVAALLSGGGAAASVTPSPTAAPITVVIPGAATPSTSPRPGSNPSPNPGSPGTDGCAEGPGETNADGSPVPGAAPAKTGLDLDLDADWVGADGWVIATASGFGPTELGQVVLYPRAVVIGSYTAGADGAFTARFRIPEETLQGRHVVEVTGWTTGCIANAEIMVVAGGYRGELVANWLSGWWVYVVLGALLVGVLSLAITFRADIAGWFGRAPSDGAAT